MKTYITLLVTLLISTASFAQGRGIHYKALVKDASGNVLSSQTIDVRFNIKTFGGTSVYEESHTTTTDANGIIIVTIGDGTTISGSFFSINWANDLYGLQTEIDPDQDGTFIDLGTTQFQAVPYAYSSGDNLWEFNGGNAIALGEKVGIGTSTPEDLLSLQDPDNAGIKLETATINDVTEIKFENGPQAGQHSFYKIENRSDRLRISVDSDLNTSTDYEEILSIAASGDITTQGSLTLDNGTAVNEFSTDGTMAGNSNNAVPTEAAVKTYVDNAIPSSIKELAFPASSFVSSDPNYSIYLGRVSITSGNSIFSTLYAPIQLHVGAVITNIEVFFRDNDVSNDISLRVIRNLSNQVAGGTVMTTITTSGNSSSGQVISDSFPITILDNYQFYFSVRPVSGDSWSNNDLGITQVRITYTE